MVVYPTRYQAQKNRLSDQVCVKVECGYTLMSYFDYFIWRKQK